MKKVIFTLFATCFVLSQGMSQITIDHSDVAPPLTKFLSTNDTLPAVSILPGAPGANQVWNFSALHSHSVDTIIMTSSQWTPDGSFYPNSNLCMMMMGSSITYTYFNCSNDSLVIVGQDGKFMGLSTAVKVKYNPVQKLFNFPASYQNSFVNHSKFQVIQYYGQVISGITIDSVRVRDKTTTTNLIDGWGSLTTPLGTFSCLRAVIKQHEQDSVWVKSNSLGPTWIDFTSTYGRNDSTKRYTWWAKNIGYTLAEIFVDPATDAVQSADYLGALPTPGAINDLTADNETSIYPNPASDMIFVSSTQLIKSISVFNSQGALVKSESPDCLSKNINIADLPKGLYIVRMMNKNDETICIKKLMID